MNTVTPMYGRDTLPWKRIQHWEVWARRLGTGGIFVYERDDRIVGFARIDDTGCLDLLLVREQMVERRGVSLQNFRMERDIDAEPPVVADAPQAARR